MITTIITTYQRPLLLTRAINSVLKQTYPHFQVCVYDNASCDETEKLMREFVKKDSRVKYHRHSENIGMMANYQFALDRVETPYFSFLSDDDFYLPCFYEEALKCLQAFPDAAFSACGIWQMDKNGNFAGDPLALWESEGYYTSPSGLLEMIKTRQRFPIPTGVLFQNNILKDIKPNFSKEIQVFWDPDYLLRIASRHPIVISKKICGVYLAHTECFSNSFYINLLSTGTNIEQYLIAVKKTMSGIESSSLESTSKRKAQKYFEYYIEQDVLAFINDYIKSSKTREINFLAEKYFIHFGFSPKIAILCLIGNITSLNILFTKIYRKFSSVWLKFIGKKSKAFPVDSKELENYHRYGEDLFTS